MDISNLDVVYTVRNGEENEELRYSLRSLRNMRGVGKVYIVGFKPKWVKNVTHIPVDQVYGSKVANTNHNWLQVAKDKRVSDRFVLFNDDFMVMKPIKALPFQHMGSHTKFENYYNVHYPSSRYTRVAQNTTKRMIELTIENPMCYELHQPTVISKLAIRLALVGTSYRFSPINIRTVALNLMEAGGERTEDVKFYNNHESPKNPKTALEDMTFISTTDAGWISNVGTFIRIKLKGKSEYER
jgi:hypothetical protein